jgi:basic amino acid/polyamine antiporter, APA family
MAFVRSIGRWALAGLALNCIIGSGIFGLPGELNRLVGRASPLAMVFAALAMACIMAAMAEVGSQFAEPGGPYLYARTVFGRFAGLQVGWFSLLSTIAAVAANANIFVIYLAGFIPGAGHGIPRVIILSVFLGVPAAVNYLGARRGAGLSSVFVIAKIVPLAVLIGAGLAGLARSRYQVPVVNLSEISAPGIRSWLTALLLLVFAYGGFEAAMIPAGEVKDPRRALPFAMGTSLLAAAVVYTLLQFVTVATIGASTSARPLAETASSLLGAAGAVVVGIAVMISTTGHVSSVMLHAPRLAYSLAARGEFPSFLAKLHPRFNTPAAALACYAGLVWLLAVTGGFYIAVMVATASKVIMYCATCAALIPLRRRQPGADALRILFGPAVSLTGVAISLALLTQLRGIEVALMSGVAILAAANWWFAKGRSAAPRQVDAGATAETLAP